MVPAELSQVTSRTAFGSPGLCTVTAARKRPLAVVWPVASTCPVLCREPSVTVYLESGLQPMPATFICAPGSIHRPGAGYSNRSGAVAPAECVSGAAAAGECVAAACLAEAE